MSRGHLCEALAWVLLIGACKGSTQPEPVRVYPRDGGSGHAQVSVVSAALTEDATRPAQEQLALELAIANLGTSPVTGVAIQEGRLDGASLDFAIRLTLDAAADASPIAPGETRHLAFSASVVPLGVCTPDLELQPNPHSGLVTMGFTVVSSAGGSALSGIDVAVTCNFPAADVTVDCSSSVADACAATDTGGNLVLHCSPDLASATRDTSLCGTGAVDESVFACQGFTYRVVIIDGVERIYAYQSPGPSNTPLVAVLAPGSTGLVCLGGPSGAVTLPACDAVLGPDAGAFAGENDICSAMDAGMPQPQPDAGVPPDGAVRDGPPASDDAAMMPPDA
jgi:hypothetical protein